MPILYARRERSCYHSRRYDIVLYNDPECLFLRCRYIAGRYKNAPAFGDTFHCLRAVRYQLVWVADSHPYTKLG
jgi:hypothetical protein